MPYAQSLVHETDARKRRLVSDAAQRNIGS
jgi:hypothetical protein